MCNGWLLYTGDKKKTIVCFKTTPGTSQVFVQQHFVNCIYYLASTVKNVC